MPCLFHPCPCRVKISNSTATKPSTSKNNSISNYCQKRCPELIEKKPVEAPNAATIHDINEIHLKTKLNDSDDDFRSPLVVRRRNNLAWKLKKAPIKKSKSKRSNKKTKSNSTIEIINENFNKDEDNPEHLQMAIALSKSSYEAEYGHSCEARNDDETPNVTEILKNAKKTNLEQFGFKVDKPLLAVESRRQHNKELPKKSRNRFKYITPILEIRTPEDRESLIASKISQILSETTEYAKRTFANTLFSSKLQYIYCEKPRVFCLNSIYERNVFYLDNLNIPKSDTKCGCLLKDWNSIPGREESPDRRASVAEPKADIRENITENLSYQHFQDNGIMGSKEPSVGSLVNSLRRSVSPDLFGSEDELEFRTNTDVDLESPLKSCSSKFVTTLTKVASFYSLDEFEEESESDLLKENKSEYMKDKMNFSSSDLNISNDVEEMNDDEYNPGCTRSKISLDGHARNTFTYQDLFKDTLTKQSTTDNSSKDPSTMENVNRSSTSSSCVSAESNADQNVISEAILSPLLSTSYAQKCSVENDIDKEGATSISSKDVPNSKEERNQLVSSELKIFTALDSPIHSEKDHQTLNCIEIFDDTQPAHYQASTSDLYKRISIAGDSKSSDMYRINETIDHQEISHATSFRNLYNNSADLNVTEYVNNLLNGDKSSFENDFCHINSETDDEMSLSGNSLSSALIDEELNYSCHFATPSRHQPLELDANGSPEDESQESLVTMKHMPKKSVEDALVSTPENYIIKTENVTPIVKYEEMTTPLINKELQKFGVKPLKRARGAKLLKYIYESTHPLLNPTEMLGGKADCEDDDKFIKRRKLFHEAPNTAAQVETDYSKYGSFSSLIGISGDGIIENERPEDLIFEKKKSKKLPSCQVPLQIVWHNFLCCNPAINENILLYEPLQLESVHMMLKEQGYKFYIQDLLTFLDRKCVTIRTIQRGRQRQV